MMTITVRKHPFYVKESDPLYTFHSKNIPFRIGETISLQVNNKDSKCYVKERSGLFKVKDIKHSLLRTYYPERMIHNNHSVTILVEEIESE